MHIDVTELSRLIQRLRLRGWVIARACVTFRRWDISCKLQRRGKEVDEKFRAFCPFASRVPPIKHTTPATNIHASTKKPRSLTLASTSRALKQKRKHHHRWMDFYALPTWNYPGSSSSTTNSKKSWYIFFQSKVYANLFIEIAKVSNCHVKKVQRRQRKEFLEFHRASECSGCLSWRKKDVGIECQWKKGYN